mmetsp:Transcript_39347/g.35036  ORF Transcript_39347/g.35036 Transcript_39347/m.35036 type:complete len:106 (+) Transcript_39347:3381-3698(+)
MLNAKLSQEKRKAGSSISRSKSYKGLRSQNYAFFVVSIIFVLIALTIISVRTWTHMNSISKMKSHGGFLQGFSSFNYEFAKLYIKFKDLLSKSFEPDNYTDAAFA